MDDSIGKAHEKGEKIMKNNFNSKTMGKTLPFKLSSFSLEEHCEVFANEIKRFRSLHENLF